MNNFCTDLLQDLYELYDFLNKTYYNGQIKTLPIITLQQDKYGKTLGWCSRDKVWHLGDGQNKDENSFYEINLSSQFLCRGDLETAEVLLHEMVHMYANENKIGDCSKSGVHNKKFRNLALEHGLDVQEKTTWRGWAFTFLPEATKKVLTEYFAEHKLVPLFRDGKLAPTPKNPSKKKYFRLVCPECDLSLRTKNDQIIYYCKECNVPLVPYEKDN